MVRRAASRRRRQDGATTTSASFCAECVLNILRPTTIPYVDVAVIVALSSRIGDARIQRSSATHSGQQRILLVVATALSRRAAAGDVHRAIVALAASKRIVRRASAAESSDAAAKLSAAAEPAAGAPARTVWAAGAAAADGRTAGLLYEHARAAVPVIADADRQQRRWERHVHLVHARRPGTRSPGATAAATTATAVLGAAVDGARPIVRTAAAVVVDACVASRALGGPRLPPAAADARIPVAIRPAAPARWP